MNKKIFIILAMFELIATPYLQAGAFTRSLRNAWHTVETHAPQLRRELNQAAQRVRQEVQAVRENILPAIRNNVPHTSFPQTPLRPYHGPTPINHFVRTPAPFPFLHSLQAPSPRHFHSSFTTPLPTNVAATSSLPVGNMTKEQKEQIEAFLNNTLKPQEQEQEQEQPLAFTGFSEEDTESSDTFLRPLNEERSDLSFSTETQSPKTTNQPADQHTLDDAISTIENQIAEIDGQLEQENSHPRTFSDEETILFNQDEETILFNQEEDRCFTLPDASNTQTTSPEVTTETHALTLYDGTSSSLTTLPDHQSSSLTVIAPQESSVLTIINNQSRALTTIYEEKSALVPTQNNEFEDLGDIFKFLFNEEPLPYAPENQQTPLMLPAGTTPLMLVPGDTPLLLSAGETPVTPPVVATQTLETLIEEVTPFEAQNQLNNLTNPSVTNPFLVPALFTAAVAAARLGKKPVNTAALRQALPAGRIALPHGAKPAVRAHVYKQVVRTTPTQSLSTKPKTNNYRLSTSLGQPKPKKPASTNFYKLPSLRPSSRPNTTPSQIYQTPVQPAAPQPTLETLAPQRYSVTPQRYSVTPVRTVAQPVAPLRTVLPEPVRTQKITITPEQPSQANLYRMPTPLEPAPIRTAPQPVLRTRAVPETPPSTTSAQPTRPIPAPRTPAAPPTATPRRFPPLAPTAPTTPETTPAAPTTPATTPAAPTTPETTPASPAATTTPPAPIQDETTDTETSPTAKRSDKALDIDTDNVKTESPTKDVPLKQEKEEPAPLQNLRQEEVKTPPPAPAQKSDPKNLEPYELVLRQGKISPVIVHGKEKNYGSPTGNNTETGGRQRATSSRSLTVRSGLGKGDAESTTVKKPLAPHNPIFDQPQLTNNPHREKEAERSTINRGRKRGDAIDHSITKEAKTIPAASQKTIISARTIGSMINDVVSSFTTYILKALQSLKSVFHL